MNLSANVIALPVQICIATTRAIGLDGPAPVPWAWLCRGSGRMNGFQVIDDSTAAAHYVPCNDDGRTSGFRQVADHGQMRLVTVDCEQLRELPAG